MADSSPSFKTVVLYVDKNDVHVLSVRCVFVNDYSEEIKPDQLVRAGQQLPLTLQGNRSFIKRTEIVARERPGSNGEAVVKVYGEPN